MDRERPKNRYARSWRAAYLRMSDCGRRQGAFRGGIREHFAEIDADSRAQLRAQSIWIVSSLKVASHAPTRVGEATPGMTIKPQERIIDVDRHADAPTYL